MVSVTRQPSLVSGRRISGASSATGSTSTGRSFRGGAAGSGGRLQDGSRWVARSGILGNETARVQVFLTMCGASLLMAAFVIVAVVFSLGFLHTRAALDGDALNIRLRVAESVNGEVARLLRPAYGAVRRLAEKARIGKATGNKLWPPTREAMEHNYTQLMALLWTQLEEELHMRRVEANGEGKEIIPFLGVFANLATKSDLRTPAASPEECQHALTVGVHVRGDNEGEATKMLYEQPTKLGFYTAFENDGNGTETASNHMGLFDSTTYSVAPYVLEAWPATCDSATRFFQAFNEEVDAGFDNFSWFGPEVGFYRTISASMPLYNAAGQRVGMVQSGISAVYSVAPMLERILLDGGSITRGALLALVSESGRLLGASEFSEIIGPEPLYDFVHEVPTESILGRAVNIVEGDAGTFCPSQHTVVDAHDRIVDAIPFYAEHYGMPPLPERWCVLLSLPRENIYASIDHAFATGVGSGCVNLVLFVLALGLFVASLIIALKSDRELRDGKMKSDLRKVLSAVEGVQSLASPMVLVAARVFLELETLEDYESLRDRGLVVVLDSLKLIQDFKQRNMIMFLSHQWLSVCFPDDADGVQLAAMKGAVRAALNDPSRERGIYVWCDYTSIAQHHTKMQQAAISSLPVYASVADKFIIIAPTATHEELGCECNLQTYSDRGWCRAEMLAKACGGGIKEMYVCTDNSGLLSPITEEDLSRLSLNIFEGHFTIQDDVERLVEPALGLYYLVLRQRRLPHMQVIHKHIQEAKDKFFPRNYHRAVTGEKAPLFGQCAALLEKCVAELEGQENKDVAQLLLRASKS